MKFFNSVDQIKNPTEYKNTTKKALKKVGGAPEKFFYVEKFKFEGGKVAPLLLIGEVTKDILSELKESMTSAAVEGKVKRKDDAQLAFAPKKGSLTPSKLIAVCRGAGSDEEPTVGSLSDEEEAVGRAKDAREAELEALRNSTARPGFQNRKEDAKSNLANMLNRTGRDGDAATRDTAREKMAGEILGKMEKATNERNAVVSPDKPESHHVSAHGPGSDQVSRLVGGHRADEITADAAAGTLPAGKVKLKGNKAGMADAEVPAYDKVGEGASNVSGAFNSNVGMLHALEEAYSQANQLDSYLSSVLKKETDAEYARVMALPDAAAILRPLKIARKALDHVQAELKKPGLPESKIKGLQSQTVQLKARVEAESTNLQNFIKTNQAKVDLGAAGATNQERFVRVVKPGTTGEKGFEEEGLGTGLELDKAHGSQKAKANIATPGKTAEEVMQERFENIKTTKGQKAARVVMDPAFVVDEKTGKKRRAGWDVQTAFPVSDAPDKDLHGEGNAERMVGRSAKIKAKTIEVNVAKQEEKTAKTAYDQAKKKREQADGAIVAKESKALPPLKKKMDLAKQAADAAAGTADADKTQKAFEAARTAHDNMVGVIATAKSAAANFLATEQGLEGPALAARAKLDKLTLELETLESSAE